MTTHKTWMSSRKLKRLFENGWTYDRIADENERLTGWRPDRSTVTRKREALGLDARREARHADLLPWVIRTQDNSHRYRHMLLAESHRRSGLDLDAREQSLVQMLGDLLTQRGKPLVVGYDGRIGWYLADRRETDDDIIRRPARLQALDSAGNPESYIMQTPGLSDADRRSLVQALRTILIAGDSGQTKRGRGA